MKTNIDKKMMEMNVVHKTYKIILHHLYVSQNNTSEVKMLKKEEKN